MLDPPMKHDLHFEMNLHLHLCVLESQTKLIDNVDQHRNCNFNIEGKI
jgi:hypothetical protein